VSNLATVCLLYVCAPAAEVSVSVAPLGHRLMYSLILPARLTLSEVVLHFSFTSCVARAFGTGYSCTVCTLVQPVCFSRCQFAQVWLQTGCACTGMHVGGSQWALARLLCRAHVLRFLHLHTLQEPSALGCREHSRTFGIVCSGRRAVTLCSTSRVPAVFVLLFVLL
jgi:hypothetical protein